MKKIIFPVLVALALLSVPFFSHAAEEFAVQIISNPEAAEISPGVSEVKTTPEKSILFTAQVDENGTEDYTWKWNFAEFHLDCTPSTGKTGPTLRCKPRSKGTSVVSITMFPEMTDGSTPAIESNQIYVNVEEASETPPEFCTEEYAPVCGKIQVQCITTPCDPMWETFPNRCYALRAGAMEIQEGACAGDRELPKAVYEDDVMTSFEGYKNPFPDTDLKKLSGQAAAELYRRGIMTGYPDGEFKGRRLVNRVELLKMLLLTRYTQTEIKPSIPTTHFKDVPLGEWFSNLVAFALEMEIIEGYDDGTFRPNNPVTTSEFLSMLSYVFTVETNAYSESLPLNLPYTYVDVPEDAWYALFAGFTEKYALFPSRGNFLNPDDKLSREEVAIAIYQYLRNRNK